MKEKSRIIKKLNNDHTRPVLFNESFGGSENQLRLLLKYLPDESFKDINLNLNTKNLSVKKISTVFVEQGTSYKLPILLQTNSRHPLFLSPMAYV